MRFICIILIAFLFSCRPGNRGKITENGSTTENYDSYKINSDIPDTSEFAAVDLVQIFDDDTLPKMLLYEYESKKNLSSKEKKALRMMWKISEVRQTALELSKRKIPFFCDPDRIDSGYQYGFYELFPDHSSRYVTYYIDKDMKEIKLYDFLTDSFKKVK